MPQPENPTLPDAPNTDPAPTTHRHYFEFANTLRGLAALCVVFSHYCGMFWLHPPVIASLTFIPEPAGDYGVPRILAWLYAIPTFEPASFGVALFFLISGFVIPFSLQNHRPAGFLISRFLRIVPTYMAGFGVTLLALWVGTRLYGQPWPFTWTEMLIHAVPGLRDITFSRGIDGIVWTLEVEIKFYLLLAFAFWVHPRCGRWVLLLPLALAVFLLFVPDAPVLLYYKLSGTYILFMLIGTVFHFWNRQALRAESALLAILGLFLLFMLAWREGAAAAALSGAWGYAYALLVFTSAYGFPRFIPANRLTRYFAAVSYPLYVVHGVAGYVLMRLLLSYHLGGLPMVVVTFATALAVASLLHHLVENPSRLLGKRLSARWLRLPMR